MPKKRNRDKRGKPPISGRTGGILSRPRSVKDLLERRAPVLTRVSDQLARQDFWHGWLSTRLATDIRSRVCGVAEQAGTLVIFAESAAWSARLRFAVLELEPDIRAAAPELTCIEVRVLPRG